MRPPHHDSRSALVGNRRVLVGAIIYVGDLDEMIKRRQIRVAVTFNRTRYLIDKGQERGIDVRALKSFENDLNANLKIGNLKVHVAPSTARLLWSRNRGITN